MDKNKKTVGGEKNIGGIGENIGEKGIEKNRRGEENDYNNKKGRSNNKNRRKRYRSNNARSLLTDTIYSSSVRGGKQKEIHRR